MNFDVCNGDADGLCAVVQWRLNDPQEARLITGLKRDIELLERVQAVRGDTLLVCDISMQRNLQPLLRLLSLGVSVRYFDHHQVDELPVHPLLASHLDFAGNTCTSLLMNQHLGGKFQGWALVGAYGDNLAGVADDLAVAMGLSLDERQRLKSLGEAINYNAYGDTTRDVFIRPEHLYEKLVSYADPLHFLASEPVAQELQVLKTKDLNHAQAVAPYFEDAHVRIFVWPDAPWSRRVSGSYSNAMAAAQPRHAHALLRRTPAGDFLVSVRAPLFFPVGAADFCRRFGGDGRSGAAGIDHLPADQLLDFVAAFTSCAWGSLPAEVRHG